MQKGIIENSEMGESNQVLLVLFTKKFIYIYIYIYIYILLIMRKSIGPTQNAAALNVSKEVNHSL